MVGLRSLYSTMMRISRNTVNKFSNHGKWPQTVPIHISSFYTTKSFVIQKSIWNPSVQYNSKACFHGMKTVCNELNLVEGQTQTLMNIDSVFAYELAHMKRTMGNYYANGNFKDALKLCIEIRDKVRSHPKLGTKNATYASSLNNIALMNKNLGNNDEAVDQYTESLHIYREIYGTRVHTSYASTLTNLGILFKTMGEQAKGFDRTHFLDRADEALTDALQTREKLLGKSHKDTMITAVNLAGLWRVNEKSREAEELLLDTLTVAKKAGNGKDLLIAMILNNLGLLLKNQKRFDDAKKYYKEAISIRSNILGENHPETVVSTHNLAELLHAEGNLEEATKLQKNILNLLNSEKKTLSVNSTGNHDNSIYRPSSRKNNSTSSHPNPSSASTTNILTSEENDDNDDKKDSTVSSYKDISVRVYHSKNKIESYEKTT